MALVVAVATLGMGLLLNRWIAAHVTPGRQPTLIFLVPTLVGGLILFGIGVLVLKAFDVPVMADDEATSSNDDGSSLNLRQ